MMRFTPEQYLELERATEFRNEYYGGEIFPRAECSYRDARIGSNLLAALGSALRESMCFVGPSILRVRTRPGGLYTYPDLVGVCGQPKFADEHEDTLLNPILIVEVLSKSTESNDRGLKFEEYRAIETLRDYVLVSQNKPLVEVYSRNSDGTWLLREYKGLDSACEFPSVGCSVKLAEIYRGTEPDPGPQ
jgi:Uma2 family endonuclease